ncbi:MAG: hypothetical protein KUG77_25185 [Nannocystaceae bacterium]|nr:hypothetical protein [Nannocystaceae bacterium]
MERGDESSRWVPLAAFAVLVAYVVIRQLGNSAYDDSYFFKRFALHAVENGVYAWNLEDGAVHGSTSQLFQLLTTGVVLFTKTHFVAALRVLDGTLLVLAAGLLLRVARGPLVLLTLGNALVTTAIRSNMETALALAVVAAALVLELRLSRDPKPKADALSAAATVLVYLARPDAAAIVAVFALLQRRWSGRSVVRYAVILGVCMALVWTGLRAVYGTALPLSFHMKTMALHTYGPHIASRRWALKVPHLLAFGFTVAPMLWLLVRARVWRRRDLTLALTLSALAFVAYHVVSTHEIMGYRARFYVPALVPLCLATARVWPTEVVPLRRSGIFVLVWAGAGAVAYGQGWAPNSEGFFLTVMPWPVYAMLVLGWSAALAWPRSTLGVAGCLVAGTLAWLPLQETNLRPDVEVLFRHNREVTTTRGVFDVARCLPAGSTVYHSEMGVPGLVLYRMSVVDQAGLLSRDVAMGGRSFQTRCAADRPEAIFLPHRNYRALNAEIAASECIGDYVRVVEHSSSPLHVRADLAKDFLRCGTEYREWR